jgi:hypothetical protein
MPERLPHILALINDVLQATIVIFGTAVVLYSLRHSFRDRVARSFNALLFFVVIVYLTELMVSRTTMAISAEAWLRLGWIGIAIVPAAQYHLGDALLATTGSVSWRRRLLVRAAYLAGIAFLGLVVFTNLIVAGLVDDPLLPHLRAGLLFPLFAIYFWLVTGASIYNVGWARRRCITTTTRQRMTMILLAFLAAPLAVFPYLLLSSNARVSGSLLFWLIVILGNLVVSIMFALLTYYIAYFGAVSPDRVVRVRLFKFMARVPLTATIVLLVYVLVNRTSTLLGLPVETALAFAVVATVMIVEWAIHAYKQPLERLFQLNDDPDVRRIQELSERLFTTRDLRQFLESILVAACDALRTPSAFVAAMTPEGPKVEVLIDPSPEAADLWEEEKWRELEEPLTESVHSSENGEESLARVGRFIVWRNYWIRPLYNRQNEVLLGIFGIQARAPSPDLTPAEKVLLDRLIEQAARALEDRVLQQGVFAMVEGLLPQVTALQLRRSAATYGGTAALTEPLPSAEATLLEDPEFNNLVWDAMSHYWGGPKLTESPLLRLQVVQEALNEHGGNAGKALRGILNRAIEQQRPEGERNMTTAEWILYNILELKFVQGRRVRDVARRLAMSESDLYRKQRVAIENVARTISEMERAAVLTTVQPPDSDEQNAAPPAFDAAQKESSG